MSDNKSQISEALNNFYEFFNPSEHTINNWSQYIPISIYPPEQENKKYVKNLVNEVVKKCYEDLENPLRKLIEIACKYKDSYFDAALEKEMQIQFLRVYELFGNLAPSFLRDLVEKTSELKVGHQDMDSKVGSLYSWIVDYLSKQNLEEIRSIIIDFCDKSALRKLIQDANVAASTQELVASTEKLSKFFSDRVEELDVEIGKKKVRVLQFAIFYSWLFPFSQNTKVIILRVLLYLTPIVVLIRSAFGHGFETIHVIPIFTFFGLISYHLTQSIRELNVLKNMRISYLHRTIVADSLESFLNTNFNKDQDVRDAIIREAAVTMFRKESSGYLSKDQMEPSNTPVQEVTKIFNK